MLKNTVLIAVAALALLALGSCGTSNVGANAPALNTPAGPGHVTAAAFQVDVMKETYDLGGSTGNVYATLDQSPQMDKGHVVVNINVDGAQDLKCLYVTLKYDPSQYRAMVAQPTKLMGDTSNVLSIYLPESRGTLDYGQVLVNPDYQTGLSGSGVVAQVSFSKEPELNIRTASNNGPPSTNTSRITNLTLVGANLTWTYYQQGDYDQNGETNGADITALAKHFKAVSPNGLGNAWPITAVESQIDGDSNGEINGADIQQIAASFKHDTQGGFHVFKSAAASDAPASPFTGPNGAGASELTPAAGIAVNAAVNIANIATERLTYSFTIAAPVANDTYWVRPADGANALGIASNTAGGNPATAPALSVTNPPASGSGTSLAPYVIPAGAASFTFKLFDKPGGVDVTTPVAPATTVFNIAANPAGPTFAANVLTVAAGYNGSFTITATYDDDGAAGPHAPQQNHSSSDIYFTRGQGNVTAPQIIKDPADPNWTNVTGTGVDDPGAYILHTSTFNPDTAPADGAYDLTFKLAATSGVGGAAIPNANLTWDAFPPFCPFDAAAYKAGATIGTFKAWQFTDGYMFAQDPANPGAPGKSNSLYVSVQSLTP